MSEVKGSFTLFSDGQAVDCSWRAKTALEAVASLGLEGLYFTEDELRDIDRFVAGEIDLDELRRIWDEELPG